MILAGCDNMKRQPGARASDLPWPRPVHTVARGERAAGEAFVTGLRGDEPLAHSPVVFTREVLARGRDRFNIYCAVCHGADGYGTGIVVRRGFPAPPSYHEPRLRDAADGYLFGVITRGYGVMLSYADRVAPADRWAIVGYIRALQRSQHATLGDVPLETRRRLVSQ